jgi:YHS domain-containing protein
MLKTHGTRVLLALATLAAMALPALAGEEAAEKAGPRRVEPKLVCMVNNAVFDKEQIPVEVEGKTYYGCCQMCKKALTEKAELRVAVDPVSGKQVDKAKAVIAAEADGSVVYFESEANFEKYRAKSG